MEKIEILKKTQVLSMMLQDELEAFAAIATVRELTPGQTAFKQGEAATSMFIVMSGAIDVIKRSPNGAEKILATLGPGALLGEMALVDLAPRAATAMSSGTGRCALVEITYSELEGLIATRPEIGVKFLRALLSIMCKRLG
jgi:CRP-like cAMP-binding protein